MKGDYVFQLDQEGYAEEIYTELESGGCMVVPKEVRGFHREALSFLSPDKLKAEPGNETYYAQNGCLINRETKTLVFTCRGAEIPEGVEQIGESAYCWEYDKTGTPLDPLRLPDSVREIAYHAFAIQSDDPIHIIVPEGTEYVGPLAFMMKCGENRDGLCRVTFLGDPEIAVGAFGSKREMEQAAEEYQWDTLRQFPSVLYTQPEQMLICAPAGARVHAYCERFGLRHEIVENVEKHKEKAIIFGRRNMVEFPREVFDLAQKDPEMLNEIYEEISAQIGVEATLQLYLLFRGQQVSFPLRFFHPDYIRRQISQEYNGSNLKELAHKYDYSEKTVRRILREMRKTAKERQEEST